MAVAILVPDPEGSRRGIREKKASDLIMLLTKAHWKERCHGHYIRKRGEELPAARFGDQAALLPEEEGIRLAHKEDLLVLPREAALAFQVAQEVRRNAGIAGGWEPQAPFQVPFRPFQGGRLQNQVPVQQVEGERHVVGRDMGEAQFHGRPQRVVFVCAQAAEVLRGLRALQDQSQEKARRLLRHPEGSRGEMADGRQVRPARMQAGRRGEVLPIHDPRRSLQEAFPVLVRRAFDVGERQRVEGGRGLLRLRPKGPPDRQRVGILRPGLHKRWIEIRPRLPERPRAVSGVFGDITQVHKAQDPGAQRQGREEPPDRPGEVLQEHEVLLARRPEEPRSEVEQEVQRDAQIGPRAQDPEPSRT